MRASVFHHCCLRKAITIALPAILLLAAGPLAAQRGHGDVNLLVDPSFESGQLQLPFTNAARGTLEVDSTVALSGLRSLKMSASPDASPPESVTGPWWMNRLAVVSPVEGPESFSFVAWAKASTEGVRVQLYIFCLDEALDFRPLGAYSAGTFYAGTEWQMFDNTQSCPQGTRYLSVRLDVDEPGATVWWDNLELLRIPTRPNLLPDPGFEGGALVAPFTSAARGTLSLDTTQSVSGGSSLKLTATGNNAVTLPWQGQAKAAVWPVTGEETFTLSAWVKGDSEGTQVATWLFCLDAAYDYRPHPRRRVSFTVGTEWERVEMVHTCPAESKFVSTRLQVVEPSSTAWWDHLWLDSSGVGRQLIHDPGFESGALQQPFTAAARGTVEIDSTEAYTGGASLRLTSNGAYNYTHTAPWQLAPKGAVWPLATPETFSLSAWVKSDAPSTPVLVYLFCLDEAYTHPSFPLKKGRFTIGQEWQRVEITHSCPQEASYVSLRLQHNQSAGSVLWDNVSLEARPPWSGVSRGSGSTFLPPDFLPGQCNSLPTEDACEANYCASAQRLIGEIAGSDLACAASVVSAVAGCPAALIDPSRASLVSCIFGTLGSVACTLLVEPYLPELAPKFQQLIDEAECCYCMNNPDRQDLCDMCEGLPIGAEISGLLAGETVDVTASCNDGLIPRLATEQFEGLVGPQRNEEILVCPLGGEYSLVAASVDAPGAQNVRTCSPPNGYSTTLPTDLLAGPQVSPFDCTCSNGGECPRVPLFVSVEGLQPGEQASISADVHSSSFPDFIASGTTSTDTSQLTLQPDAYPGAVVNWVQETGSADCTAVPETLVIPPDAAPGTPVKIASVYCNGSGGGEYSVGGMASYTSLEDPNDILGYNINLSAPSGQQLVTVTVPSGSEVPFTFPDKLVSGEPYGAFVSGVTANYQCHVANGTGTITNQDVNDLHAICVETPETIGDPCEWTPTLCYHGPTESCDVDVTVINIRITEWVWTGSGGTLTEKNRTLIIYDIYCPVGGSAPLTGGAATAASSTGPQPAPYVYFRTSVPGTVVDGFEVRGVARHDASGVSSVEFRLDGQPVNLSGLAINQHDQWTCNEIPESNCRSNSGFNGWLDTSGLAPGSHQLVVKAVSNDGYASQNIDVLNFEVGAPVDNAQVLSSNVPTSMTCDDSRSASLTVRNTGNTNWTRSEYVRLGRVGSDPFGGPSRVYLPSGVTVAPNQSHTFTWTMTAPSAAGSYLTDWKMVRDGAGGGWFGQSFSRYVQVSCPLAISQQPPDRSVDAGGTTTFAVAASGGSPPYSYQWQGRTPGESSWWDMGDGCCQWSGSQTPLLTIADVPADFDGGGVRCRVTDSAGTTVTTRNAVLNVTSAPLAITLQPVDQTVPEGGRAVFSVGVTGGSSPYSYQWQVEPAGYPGLWVDLVNDAQTSGVTQPTLVEDPVIFDSMMDGAHYRCRITDGAGTVVYSSGAQLSRSP